MTHLLDVNYLPRSYSRYVNLQTSASKEDLDTYQCIQEVPQDLLTTSHKLLSKKIWTTETPPSFVAAAKDTQKFHLSQRLHSF